MAKNKLMNYLNFFLLIVIIAAAIYIRFKNLGGRSLWLDEAWVANAISQAAIKGVIENSLTAPLFFVLTIHWIITIFANNEFFLRLLPCLFGLGTIIVFYLVIRDQITKISTLLVVAMFSFSPNFVRYSQELKQYSGAMFFTILLIYFCEEVIAKNKMIDWIILFLLSLLGIGFDHSIIFVIIPVCIVLLVNFTLQNHKLIALIYGLTIFIFYVFFFFFRINHQISENLSSIQSYWLSFYPNTKSLAAFFHWLYNSSWHLVVFLGLPYFFLSLIIMVIGLSLFYKHSQKRFIIYILLPIILVLGAAFFHRYPFGGTRLMLFIAPLLYMSFGKGLDFIIVKLKNNKLYFALILLAVFIGISPVSNFFNMVNHPLRLEEIKPILEVMQPRVKSTDKIYVYYGAAEAFKYYYHSRYSRMINKKNIIWGASHRDDLNQYIIDLKKIIRKDMRIWVLFSHYREKERILIFNYLISNGELKFNISNKGTIAYLIKIKADFSEVEK